MLGKSRLKYIQSLGHKKQREQEGLFIAEGPKLAEELLVSMALQVREIFAVESWIARFQGLYPHTTMIPVTEDELSRMSQLATANQVITVLAIPDPVTTLETAGRVTLALDTIQDPGNLGTIIRIADWFGITQLACNHGTADLYNPKVVQSTMGSIARVTLLYTDLHDWLEANKGNGLYAAALDGTDITQMAKLKEGIIIIGNESKGIDPLILDMVSHKITIPRIGHAESLNAAVATGIILSHLV
ncbi:MAG: RNA methyltransferase [Chitinophagaceae bacterium]|nr:MAG: RNA methyltransferase [Chitinophagaceae bacterium]